MRMHWDVMIEVLKGRSHKRGAEIGVAKGNNAYRLLEGLPHLDTLYCVDRWDFYPGSTRSPERSGSFDKIRKEFFDRLKPFRHRIILLWMDSLEAARQVEDGSLDFIFIDANHKYEFVTANMEAWTLKVRTGGIIAGHDYGYGEGERGFGVRAAVNDYFGEKNIKVDDNYTWWLKKTI